MVRAALRNPYLIVVIALAITVLGGYSYTKLPADLLPQFNTPAVQIVCFYPGMPPEVMEKDIMSRLQRWTGQSVGIEHQEAKAMQSVCIVKDFFREGISMDTAMSQVSAYAMSDMYYLPPGTVPPMVMPFDPTAAVPLCLVVVSNELMEEGELYDIAYYELRNKLQSIQGVIAPAVYGGKLRRILAYVDPLKLESHGLSVMDVQRALMSQNVLIPAGSIKDSGQELQIFTNANVEKVEMLNDIPIKMVNGQFVYLRDVARVDKSSYQIQSNIVRINNSRKAYIPIYRQPGANTISIVKQINTQLSTIENRLKLERSEDPKMKSLVLSVAMDQSIGVEKGNRALQIAAALGAALAGLVVLVFLRSWRFTLVIVLAIPIAILFSILVMYLIGRMGGSTSINAMTLGGLSLAIGILIDQSIVVLENVIRHKRMGKTSTQAALEGTQEVMLPMLVATLTFAVVFLPVIFLTGMAKLLFQPIAISAVMAIIASYFLAITMIPAYCAKFMPNVGEEQESRGPFTRFYGGILKGCLNIRPLIVLCSMGLFAFSAWYMATQMGRELFPQVDSSQVTIYARLPSGTDIQETEKTIIEIEKDIVALTGEPDPAFAKDGIGAKPNSDLQILISNIGVLLDWPAAYTPNNAASDAFLLVQTKGKKSIFEYVTEMRKNLNKKYPDVDFAFDTGGMLSAAINMGEPSPIHFQIQTSDLEQGQEIAAKIIEVAKSVEGTADSRVAQRIDSPTLEVDINREMALEFGLTVDEVMKSLISVTNSSINFDPAFWIDKFKGNHYFLGVQYAEGRLSAAALNDIPIGGDKGSVRMGDVVKFDRSQGPAVVNHRNISRVTDVFVNVIHGHDVGGVCQEIENRLAAQGAIPSADERGALYRLGEATPEKIEQGEFPADAWEAQPLTNVEKFKGRTFRMMGEVQTMRDSFSQFSGGLLIATILVYLVMVALFRSFLDPIIVLLAVPLGFIGVVGILVFTETHLSIMSFMGIIMMVGIVVEYSIVLVDFANKLVEKGHSPYDAIVEASLVRLRPILMTSLTTWLAMLPMAIGFGGGEANIPLARAIIGGVIGATILTLIVVPCLYVMLKSNKRIEVANEG